MVMLDSASSYSEGIPLVHHSIQNRSPVSYTRWLLAVFIGLILFCNHYVRDCPGALEKAIETELSLSPQDFSILNSLYFFPNIISPLIAGMLIDKLGGIIPSFYISLVIASAGHILFGIGATCEIKGVMYLGKGLSGSMYEIIDAVMPIVYLSTLFHSNDQIVVFGFLQVLVRLGSVVNFIVSPYIYKNYGLLSAIWIGSCVGVASIVFLFLSRYMETNYLSSSHSDSNMRTASSSSSLISGKNSISKLDENEKVDEEVGFELVSAEDDHYSRLTYSVSVDENSGLIKKSNSYMSSTAERSKQDKNNEKFHYQSLSQTNDKEEATEDTRLPTSSSAVSPVTFSPSLLSSLWSTFIELTQFHQFSLQYYLYLIAGAFLYGSIVPFWFYGSKYLQDNFDFPVENADWVMALPEGLVVITGFPFGLLVSKLQVSVKAKLLGFSVSLLFMSLSFWILIYSAGLKLTVQPSGYSADSVCYFSVIFLGISFSCSGGLFWGVVYDVVDNKYLNQGSGILSCAVNILPAVLPPFFVTVSQWTQSDHSTIILLAFQALLGSIAAGLAAFQPCCNSSSSDS
jgi:hypothetical protein